MPVDEAAVASFIGAVLDHPARAAVLTDFDGTLSPIVDDPAGARPLPEVPAVLAAVAQRVGRAAVISGRPVQYLIDALGEAADSGLILSGSYGLERYEKGMRAVHDEALAWVPAVDALADLADAQAPEGVYVERKGLSVTIHVRPAPQHLEWARQWAIAQSHDSGLALHDARMSFELRPPVHIDKGTIAAELVSGVDAACFLGDDVGDLPAFDALDRAEAEGVHVLRVGVRSSEIPEGIAARADLLVPGPEGALSFLRSLISPSL